MTAIRQYEAERDADSIRRVWNEIGWLDPENRSHQELAPLFYSLGSGYVAEVNGHAECSAFTCPGAYRHLEQDLPFAAVSAVTTGLVARKRGYATRATAMAVAEVARQGALASGLGMFDQGFYDRLGFGSGPYDYYVHFDPAHLEAPVKARTPIRFSAEDWEAVHAGRLGRKRGHGAVSLTPAAYTRIAMAWSKGGHGLGYRDETGALTHGFWYSGEHLEHGPLDVEFLIYRDGHDLLELFDLMRHMGEAVRSIRLIEPSGFQVQDLMKDPGRTMQARGTSKYPVKVEAHAWWQIRLLDIPGALAATYLAAGNGLRFNLHVTDPISVFAEETGWGGVAGEYTITLGEPCEAARGSNPALPTLHGSINAFSRMWFGARPATGLALTHRLEGPEDLLKQLDAAFCLPHPCPEWIY